MNELIAPFITDDINKDVSKNVTESEHLLEETFFVELIDLQETSVIKFRHVIDTQNKLPLCLEAQDCVECSDRLNNEYTITYPDVNNEYKDECIRLYSLDITESQTYELLMKNKIEENHMLNNNQKKELYKVQITNKKVFESRLGKWTSYIHQFQIIDSTPFNHKCRTTNVTD